MKYAMNLASAYQIANHLSACDRDFVTPLSTRVSIGEYAQKIYSKATRFEAWREGDLVGVLAVYRPGWFITNVSVLPSYQRQGIARELMQLCVKFARERSAEKLLLRVGRKNKKAIDFYLSQGWSVPLAQSDPLSQDIEMTFYPLTEARGTLQVTRRRNFDIEARDTPTAKYAYDFDTEVMHPMMIRTFEPWFRHQPPGEQRQNDSVLELGSYKGAFTRRLLQHFYAGNITCVEASKEARIAAVHYLSGNDECRAISNMNIVGARFETAKLPRRYDNIFCTHVLEHVDDPVLVLRRVNDEWLAPGGRLFLAVPNANAASRRIAVHMGLIENCMAVTPDEEAHGHRRTYDLDLLEYHARLAGLKVIARGGIFFKALANFQIDHAMREGIIQQPYLEGCYALGQQFPDLCASIYLICERGEAR